MNMVVLTFRKSLRRELNTEQRASETRVWSRQNGEERPPGVEPERGRLEGSRVVPHLRARNIRANERPIP